MGLAAGTVKDAARAGLASAIPPAGLACTRNGNPPQLPTNPQAWAAPGPWSFRAARPIDGRDPYSLDRDPPGPVGPCSRPARRPAHETVRPLAGIRTAVGISCRSWRPGTGEPLVRAHSGWPR